jgi:hypothetical protein
MVMRERREEITGPAIMVRFERGFTGSTDEYHLKAS